MYLTIRICVIIAAVVPGLLAFPWGSNNNYSLLCDAEKGALGCLCPKENTDHEVDCSKKDITVIPGGISFPTGVEVVNFKENRIEIIGNSLFTSGRGLHTLDLSFNKIHFLATNSFFHLETIQKLDLSHNDLWNLPIGTFEGLAMLSSLDLSYNRISNFFPDVFKPCVNVKELVFRFNPMLFVEYGSFKFLPALESLNLENTGLGTLPADVFTNNRYLQNLMLGANVFRTVPLRGLHSAPSLKTLDISENPIEVLDNGCFKGLNELQYLTVSHMRQLRSVESGGLSGLPSLKELYLSDNPQLSYISETAFLDLNTDESALGSKTMSRVVLRHCGLKGIPKFLLNWEDIAELDLSENPWNCDCKLGWIADSDMSVKSKKTMMCTSPSHLGGKTVAGLSGSDFTCRLLSPEAITGLALLVSLSFIFALSGVTFILYRRSFCKCLGRDARHRYMRVVSSKEKVDLEWDHGAEPRLESSKA